MAGLAFQQYRRFAAKNRKPKPKRRAAGLRAHAREPLVDAEPVKRKKISQRRALSFLDPRAKEARRLISRLFFRPLTSADASWFFTSTLPHGQVVYTINQAFRKKVGEDAVIRIPLWKGRRVAKRCWVLALNPKLFTVPEKAEVRAATDFGVEDILTKTYIGVLKYLARHPWTSVDELRKRFSRATVDRLLWYINDRHLDPRIELDLPDPVIRTETKPISCRVNPKFVESYPLSLPEEEKRSVEDLFGKNDVELLRELARYRFITLGALAGERKERNVHQQIRKINRRCGELGLPRAVTESKKRESVRGFRMNKNFAKKFGIETETVRCLEVYFTPQQFRIITHMVENPLCTSKDIAKALGIEVSSTRRLIQEISAICRREEMEAPQLINGGRTGGAVYYLPEGFLTEFELPQRDWDPERLIQGTFERRVYRKFSNGNSTTVAKVARALGRSRNDITKAIARTNRKLERFGFDTI